MKYKDIITNGMDFLAKQDKTVFIGEGLINAGHIYGTMTNVPKDKCVEMPIAENLIMGVGMGLSMGGYIPIIVFQRMDFMLNAADCIINHLALAIQFSGGVLRLPLIIRCIVGSQSKTFDVGQQHRHDFTSFFSEYIQTYKLEDTSYESIYNEITRDEVQCPVIIVEHKDKYETEINDAITQGL